MNPAQHFFEKESARVWQALESHADQLHEPIRDDEWTAWMLAAHIVTATRAMIEIALKQLEPSDTAITAEHIKTNIDHWNDEQMATWQNKTIDELHTAWDKTTKRFVTLLETIEQQPDPERILYHPAGMQFNLAGYLQVITIHMRMHRTELTEGLATLNN